MSSKLDIYVDRNEILVGIGPSHPATSWPVTPRGR